MSDEPVSIFKNFDKQTLVCTKCGRLTSGVEARTRRVNTLKCGQCGGDLKVYKDTGA